MTAIKIIPISGKHEIIRIINGKGDVFVKVKCGKAIRETGAMINPSLNYCPFCEDIFDKNEIEGHLMTENLENFLKNRQNVSSERNIIESMEKILKISNLVDISDEDVKRIISCLKIKPTLRGEKLLSEIGCFGVD